MSTVAHYTVNETEVYTTLGGSHTGSTWDVTVVDNNNQKVTATGTNFIVNYPTFNVKRTNVSEQETYAAANFLATLKNPALETLYTFHCRYPSNYTTYKWSSHFTQGTQVTVYRRDGERANATLLTSAFFNTNNKTSRTVKLRWVASLESGSPVTSWNTNITNRGLYSRNANSTLITANTYTRNDNWNVEVTLDAPPVIGTPSISFSGPSKNGAYYAGLTKCTVSYSNIRAQFDGDITQIKFDIGGSSNHVNNPSSSGSLSVTPPTARTCSPKLTVTDSRGQTSTYTFSQITYIEPSKPTISSGSKVTSSTTNGFWAGISTGSVTITGTSQVPNGTISSTKLTIGSNSWSRSGNGTIATSTALSTAGTFTPVIQVTDNYGLSSTQNLSNIVVQTPSVNAKLDVFRIDSNDGDKKKDEGTSACIVTTISRSRMSSGSTALSFLTKPTIKVGSTDVTSNVTWYTTYSNTDGFSNAVNWTSYNPETPVTLYGKLTSQTFSKDNNYVIKITPKATIGGTARTGAEITDTLSASFYLLVGRAGGRGLGIGQKPPTDALYINMPTYLSNESPIRANITRKVSGGSGWAYTPFIFEGADGASFANIGAYGSADEFSYIYIGAEGYSGNNLRVYKDGHIWANTIEIQKTTVATNTYADANPKLIFKNGNDTQNASLTWTDYDSVQSPTSLTLNGNQGGEYFIAPNIKATTRFYGALTGNVTGNCSGSSGSCTGNAATATKATQDGSGNTITSTYLKLSGGTMTGTLTLANATWIVCRNQANNTSISAVGSSTSNQLFFGYGSYNNSIGASYFDGNIVYIRSKGNIEATAAVAINLTVGSATNHVYTNGYLSAAGSYSGTVSTDNRLAIASGGKIGRYASSSKRYKENIKNSEFDPHGLYGLPIRQFNYKSGYFSDADDNPRAYNTQVGFIAEEVQECFPAATVYDGNQIESWEERKIIPPMLQLIQEQHEEIEQLKKEVAELKNK